MSTEKMYTEREMVLAQRRAFWDGAQALYCHEVIPAGPSLYSDALDEVRATVEDRYPLPRVTRPRVVKDAGGYDWRIRDAQLEYRGPGGTMWNNVVNFGGPEDRWTAIRDLLANPTETVDADD